jgi:hypothetical protein
VNVKILTTIQHYKTKLARKEKIIQPYKEKINDIDYTMTEKEYADFKVLEAEISLIKLFLDDLDYIFE